MKYAPCESKNITSRFGLRTHPISGTQKHHNGIDFGRKAISYEPIFATDDGIVILSMDHRGAGKWIRIQHSTYISGYMHLHERKVDVGDEVKAGQVIGNMGTTGSSTGIHLHFEVLQGNKYLDPLPYIKEVWGRNGENELEEEDEVRYSTFDDVPEWGKVTVKKLMDKGILQGGADAENNTKTVLNLSEDMLRILVINDRSGLYK